MKNKLLLGVAVAAVITLIGSPATAAECIPADARTEVVVTVPAIPATEAVGEPTIEVPNPDYVPGIPAQEAQGEPTIPNPDYQPEVVEVTEVVHHEAETKVIEHAAVTHTEYHFSKFTRERTKEKHAHYGWLDWSEWGDWSEWVPETHTSWRLDTNPVGSPQFHADGRDGDVKWERQWQARHDGVTREVVDKAAWSETVVVKEAWDETVIVVEGRPAVGEPTIANPDYRPATPAIPAQGEPTITVPNPDYKPATEGTPEQTSTVQHEAVECPAAFTAALAEPTADEPALAETGNDVPWALIGIAGLLILGSLACAVSVGATKHYRR